MNIYFPEFKLFFDNFRRWLNISSSTIWLVLLVPSRLFSIVWIISDRFIWLVSQQEAVLFFVIRASDNVDWIVNLEIRIHGPPWFAISYDGPAGPRIPSLWILNFANERTLILLLDLWKFHYFLVPTTSYQTDLRIPCMGFRKNDWNHTSGQYFRFRF